MLRSAGLAAWGGARARGARPCGPSLPRHYCVRPGMHKSPITDQLWAEREKLLSCAREGPAAGEGVVLRKVPAESAVAMKYAFSTDHTLRDQYRNPFGGVRMGILLEDMDATAGNIAVSMRSARLQSSRRKAGGPAASLSLFSPTHVGETLCWSRCHRPTSTSDG